jgi:hypothetical protein
VNSQDVRVLLGSGDGTLQNQTIYPAGNQLNGLIVSDFNNDSKLDVVVVGSEHQISVLLGSGDGMFQKPMYYSSRGNPVDLTTSDFNNDRKLDLAVLNNDQNTIGVLLDNGNGTFENPEVSEASS